MFVQSSLSAKPRKLMSEKGVFDHSQGSEEVRKDWFHWPLASVRPPGITLPWTEALRGSRAREWERPSCGRALWLWALRALSRVVEVTVRKRCYRGFCFLRHCLVYFTNPSHPVDFYNSTKVDIADVPRLCCWRCRVAKEQTDWGRGRTAQISIPGGLEESFFFPPSMWKYKQLLYKQLSLFDL